jgi:hypothetical protein
MQRFGRYRRQSGRGASIANRSFLTLSDRSASRYCGRFSNRPFWVKRYSDYPPLRCRCHSRARASLRTRHQGPSIMGSENEVEQSNGRPCRWQVQATERTHLIHRPARDTIPPLGGARDSSLLLLYGCHAAGTVSRVHLNSVPSTQMRCRITANRRASATSREGLHSTAGWSSRFAAVDVPARFRKSKSVGAVLV